MKISVQFWSYFKDLTGCENTEVELTEGDSIAALRGELQNRFPKLKEMERSTLIAVGVEYQPLDYELSDGDQVSFFPPVQGG
ncbi:MAG: MoaD/ThiS family protein [Limisphaerales bacterium]